MRNNICTYVCIKILLFTIKYCLVFVMIYYYINLCIIIYAPTTVKMMSGSNVKCRLFCIFLCGKLVI